MELGDSSMDENGKEHQFGPDDEKPPESIKSETHLKVSVLLTKKC